MGRRPGSRFSRVVRREFYEPSRPPWSANGDHRLKTIRVFLFPDFTALDAFGPLEVLSRWTEGVSIDYVSPGGGLVRGSGQVRVATQALADPVDLDVFLVPGGMGTRTLVNDEPAMASLRAQATRARYVLSVCTGSALLGKAGMLDHRRATSNKRAWDWVVQQSQEAHWVRRARWVVDGNLYTSSGVAAGIDMALGFVRDRSGEALAEDIAHRIEYVANPDPDNDPF